MCMCVMSVSSFITESHVFQNWTSKDTKTLDDVPVLSIWCAQLHAHTTTSIISLMHVKNNMCHFCLWNLLSWTMEWIKWKKEQNIENASNWIVDHFSLTFVNILLTWMLRFHFHVWLQNKGKILKKVWRKYCNQFGIYQCFHVTLLEPWQKT